MTEIIEAKVEGRELVTPPVTEQAEVINLMDALKKSVQQVAPPAKVSNGKKPSRATASSSRQRTAAKKKKSG
jgi:non-homologous end joining protein Ku